MERERIAAVIPAVPQDIGLEDLPNEGGLDAPGISYAKGCYLGQEIMARLKTRGQVRRRLIRVRGPGVPPPLPAALWQDGRAVGGLRSAAPETSGADFVGLALLTFAGLRWDEPLALSPSGPPAIALR